MDENLPVKKTIPNQPSDLISSLPGNLIENILTCLPLSDAVRTSILSRKWRYYWINIPNLVFDGTLLPGLTADLCSRNKLMMTIYEILLRHRGPILKFYLCFMWLENRFNPCGLEDFSRIDQLILFLSQKGVQEFHLLTSNQPYKLPSAFFSFVQLMHLTLDCCAFKPPPAFNGFRKLVSLSFGGEFDGNITTFLSNFPLLESLTIVQLLGSDRLEFDFDAPLLKSLRFCSSFSSIRFKNTPFLTILSINSMEEEFNNSKEGETSKMIEVFSCILAIKELKLGDRVLKFLTFGGVPEKLPFPLNQLQYLELKIMRSNMNAISVSLCLIKSSPNLEKVKFMVLTNEDEHADDEQLKVLQYHSDFSSNRLREVEMWFISGTMLELEFIKIILAKSFGLEKMTIMLDDEANDPNKYMEVLNSFERASSEAKVLFEFI